jgi:hypothetical protein
MKTLIIHPKDKSTDFLKIIYKNIKDKKVIIGGISKQELQEIIPSYDRIMMMGHGSPFGLFSVGQFKPDKELFPFDFGYIIDRSIVNVLKNNPNNVYIWCNADKFVLRNNLQGFSSGMFCSELSECYYCGIKDVTQELVTKSNMYFCEYMGKYINEDNNTLHKIIKEKYGELAETNPVASYNNERLYIF